MSNLNDRVKAATAPVDDDAERPASTDIAARDKQLAWLQSHASYFVQALPRHVDAMHFMAVARSILPKLADCTDTSIMQSLLACARFGLEPDGKQAAIIPYGAVATFQPMYEGYIELMYRHPRIDSVHFGWIREKDNWSYTPTAPSPQDFFHQPRVELTEEERGPVILAYAFAWIDGNRSQVIILNRKQAEDIRDQYSKAYAKAERGKKDSAWHTDFLAMWAKSAVLRLRKVVPTSTELADLMREDRGEPETGDNTPTVIRGHVVDRGDGRATAADWPPVTGPGAGAASTAETAGEDR